MRWREGLLVAAAAALLGGCGPQTVRFYLTDAPLDGASEVNVTLTGLKIFTSGGGMHQGDEDGEGMQERWRGEMGPHDGGECLQDGGTCEPRCEPGDGGDCGFGPETIVFDEPRTYNLLALRDGAQVLLGEVDVYGRIVHMNLLMAAGTAEVVYSDGSVRQATIPSGASSGIKIKGPIPQTGEVLLDFDAAESIHENGEGELIMRPVIHVVHHGRRVRTSEPIPEDPPVD